ncbi:uncharacterized protein LOC132682458 [Panthera onca]
MLQRCRKIPMQGSQLSARLRGLQKRQLSSTDSLWSHGKSSENQLPCIPCPMNNSQLKSKELAAWSVDGSSTDHFNFSFPCSMLQTDVETGMTPKQETLGPGPQQRESRNCQVV